MDREGGVILFASHGAPIIVTAASHALINATDMYKRKKYEVNHIVGVIDR